MCAVFSSAPSIPAPPPPVPAVDDAEVRAAEQAERARARRARGRAASILTSGQGDLSPAPSFGKRLLGR